MVKFGYGARGVLVAGILLGTSTGALAAGVAAARGIEAFQKQQGKVKSLQAYHKEIK